MTVSRFSGENGDAQLIESARLDGNLHSLHESVQNFVLRYVDLEKAKPKKRSAADTLHVRPRGVYNLYAVREAIANALVHRDLALRDVPTRVNIFDDAIEFINARRTSGFVPPASRAIRYGITQRLNPQIAAVFGRREYGASIPRGGLPMVLKQSSLFSGRRAEVFTANDEFRLKIYSA